MRAFVASVVVALGLAVIVAVGLDGAQTSAFRAFSTEGTRITEPGQNLVGPNW
jgi:hypothetical protein